MRSNSCISIICFSSSKFFNLSISDFDQSSREQYEKHDIDITIIIRILFFSSDDRVQKVNEISIILFISELRILSVLGLHLVLTHSLNEFCQLFKEKPLLKYLNVQDYYEYCHSINNDKYFEVHNPVYLKELIIGHRTGFKRVASHGTHEMRWNGLPRLTRSPTSIRIAMRIVH